MTGQRIAIKWPSLELAVKYHKELVEKPITEQAEVFRDIQTMEVAAIVELRTQERERKKDE